MDEQNYPGRVINVAGSAREYTGAGKVPRESIMGLTEETMKQVEELKAIASMLEDKLDCVCVNNDRDSVAPEDGLKPEEPNLNRPDNRLIVINRALGRLAFRLKELNSKINIQ